MYDAPADGSCMYYAISAVFQKEATPSAGTFKERLVKFYTMNNANKRKMRETFNISFEARLNQQKTLVNAINQRLSMRWQETV